MQLLEHQIVLGRCLRAADGDHWHRSLHVQGIGLDRAKLAELHDLGLSLYSARSTLLVRGTHR